MDANVPVLYYSLKMRKVASETEEAPNVDVNIPVLEVLWTSSFIFVIVEEGTGISLSAQSGGSLAGFRFVVGQDKCRFCVCTCVNVLLAKIFTLTGCPICLKELFWGA